MKLEWKTGACYAAGHEALRDEQGRRLATVSSLDRAGVEWLAFDQPTKDTVKPVVAFAGIIPSGPNALNEAKAAAFTAATGKRDPLDLAASELGLRYDSDSDSFLRGEDSVAWYDGAGNLVIYEDLLAGKRPDTLKVLALLLGKHQPAPSLPVFIVTPGHPDDELYTVCLASPAGVAAFPELCECYAQGAEEIHYDTLRDVTSLKEALEFSARLGVPTPVEV